uniref:Calcium uniporter protein n=1 Tax=Vannella robusta TaxID=1487602 RepID=A0A7S4IGX2_9EUKA|mmetsp:Transcript_25675/g.32734  ORF Transcript_25675/g.32734 Transcript_25675/m.32734 type:complete len:300 (+) Transcript_25675:10-909(+)
MFTRSFVSLRTCRSSALIRNTFVSCYSTPVPNPQETKNIVSDILRDAKKIQLRKSLQIDPRYRITREEYLKTAEHLGIEKKEAESFLHHLSAATVVTTVPLADNYIFLKPEELGTNMIDVVDAQATELQQKIAKLKETLQKEKEERDRLHSVKVPLDTKAERAASRLLYLGLAGMVGHLCLVARLTWWELSWDIVEPITYMITYSTAAALLLYFCSTRVEYQYESLFQRMVEKRKRKIYRRHDFNIERYTELVESIKRNSQKLEELSLGIPPHAVFADHTCDVTHLILPEEHEKTCSSA